MLDQILILSRIQFAGTAIFHILFPMMSIGTSLYLFIMECLWLYTKKESYYRQLRFWMKIFILSFAIGVASGFPMAFQFGTNWSGFANSAGSFFGNIIGFETTVAFTLESTFLGIFLFGWKRVPKPMHLIANFLVLFGASLSAFWIIAANSWMQIPQGVHMEAGKVIVDDYFKALFNSDTLVSYIHMWLACVESTIFLLGGIAAWGILRHRENAEKRTFFSDSLKYFTMMAIVVVPLQLYFGDISGTTVAKYQPEKLAAYELHWNTNPAGEGAPLHLIAWPNKAGNGNAFEVSVPMLLSFLSTHTTTGTVIGLNNFNPKDRPTTTEAVTVFYSFRIMVLVGMLLLLLMIVSLYYLYKGELASGRILSHTRFLNAWVWSIPLGFIAAETGWMVREIGRQPWMIYHMLRVSESVSVGLNSIVVGVVLVAVVLLYLTLFGILVHFIRKITLKGPDLTSTIH
jgi:cytochrome d ubiquinol oxidase subunit I